MRFTALALLVLVACGGGGDEPPDAGPPDPDASPCASNELCLSLAPIDGVTALPPGRLAVAWIVIGGDTGGDQAQIAFDAAWTAAPLTRVALPQLAAPDASFVHPFECATGPINAAIGVAAVLDDPDDSGDITAVELLTALQVRGLYGIAQAIVLDAPAGCSTPSPELPAGILAGRHAYAGNEDTAFTPADGVPAPLTTCSPGTPACQDLEGPI